MERKALEANMSELEKAQNSAKEWEAKFNESNAKIEIANQKDAEKIYLLEMECQQGRNVKENMAKIEEIMKNYSLLDMLKIDEYLTTKFFDK